MKWMLLCLYQTLDWRHLAQVSAPWARMQATITGPAHLRHVICVLRSPLAADDDGNGLGAGAGCGIDTGCTLMTSGLYGISDVIRKIISAHDINANGLRPFWSIIAGRIRKLPSASTDNI